MERRRFLTGTAAAAALLAGCGSNDSTTTGPGDGTDPTTDSPTTDDPTTDSPTTEPPTTETPEDPTTEAPTDSPTDNPTTVVPGLRNGSFESGLDSWTVGRQLPDDPNNPGKKVESSAEATTREASDGQQALEIFIDGSQDDGIVWVQQQVDLTGVSTLKVDGYSETESFNEILQVATYAGPAPDDGLTEAAFDRSNKLADHEGWKTYEYDVQGGDDVGESGLVAVGLNIVWETGAAGILDNVRLE